MLLAGEAGVGVGWGEWCGAHACLRSPLAGEGGGAHPRLRPLHVLHLWVCLPESLTTGRVHLPSGCLFSATLKLQHLPPCVMPLRPPFIISSLSHGGLLILSTLSGISARFQVRLDVGFRNTIAEGEYGPFIFQLETSLREVK